MLTLTFLGVGSAFAKRNYQSNMLIEAWSSSPQQQQRPDETLLIDFGATGPRALYSLMQKPGFEYLQRAGCIDYAALQKVFITHLHGDHIGGLDELAILNALGSGSDGQTDRKKPLLLGAEKILDTLWTNSLSGSLGAMHGRHMSLQDYFEVQPLGTSESGVYESFTLLDRYGFEPFPTHHVQISVKFDWPSFGLRMTDRQSGATALFSGDTRFDPELIGRWGREATVCFHEVQLQDADDPVHTLLSELRSLPDSDRRKMVLYHFDDSWDETRYDYIAEDFAGLAVPHQRYTVFE